MYYNNIDNKTIVAKKKLLNQKILSTTTIMLLESKMYCRSTLQEENKHQAIEEEEK